jgi:hypothetical protein
MVELKVTIEGERRDGLVEVFHAVLEREEDDD